MASTRERNIAIVAIAAGLLFWIFCLHAAVGTRFQWLLAAVAAAMCLVPPARISLGRAAAELRCPTRKRAWGIAGFLLVASTSYFVAAAYFQAWDFILRYQDEHSYALQITMLSHGRLWLDALDPTIADFFGSLNILTSPRYGSMYFPGTALTFVPFAWLHLPFWAGPAIAGGACVALTYLVLLELLDGAVALLGALLLASLPHYRATALMLLSQLPLLLLGLAMLLTWLRWRVARRPWQLVLLGVLVGWAGITRPLDALCFVVPILAGLLADVPATSWSSRLRALALVAVAGSPFLLLQAFQNHAMTGSWTTFPIDYFHARTYPAPLLGFHSIDWAKAPVPKLAQNREMVQTSAWPLFRDHTLSRWPHEQWSVRLPRTLRVCLAAPAMAVLLIAGFFRLSTLPRRVVAAIPVLFFLAYSAYIFYQPHYIVAIAPALIFLALLGVEVVAKVCRTKCQRFSRVLMALLFGLAIGAFAEADDATWSAWLDLARIEAKVKSLPAEPAIVLFRYHPMNPRANISFHEPVYNIDAPSIDDATIIRAHDLGAAEDQRLFAYYAKRQPNRVVYLYDRLDDSIRRLGTVAALAGEAR